MATEASGQGLEISLQEIHFQAFPLSAAVILGPVDIQDFRRQERRFQGTFATDENVFYVQADLSDLLAEHGPGVYLILVWGNIDGSEKTLLSHYSFFHEIDVPDSYSNSGH